MWKIYCTTSEVTAARIVRTLSERGVYLGTRCEFRSVDGPDGTLVQYRFLEEKKVISHGRTTREVKRLNHRRAKYIGFA